MGEIFILIAWEKDEAPQVHGAFTRQSVAEKAGERLWHSMGASQWFFVEVHALTLNEQLSSRKEPVWEYP